MDFLGIFHIWNSIPLVWFWIFTVNTTELSNFMVSFFRLELPANKFRGPTSSKGSLSNFDSESIGIWGQHFSLGRTKNSSLVFRLTRPRILSLRLKVCAESFIFVSDKIQSSKSLKYYHLRQVLLSSCDLIVILGRVI